MNKKMLETLGYNLNERKLGSLENYFSEDYKNCNFVLKKDDIAYSGAEHRGKPKLTNITILPNLLTEEEEIILGCSFGHQHISKTKKDKRKIQELYEFLGYGAMFLRNSYETSLYVLKPGEKVITKPEDNMTIFNLGQEPLATIDYANPDINDANKDLEKRIGTIMMIKHSDRKTSFYINPHYYSNKILNRQDYDSLIVIRDVNLGENLHKKIIENKDEFLKRGINVVSGGNLTQDLKKEFSHPLLKLVLNQNNTLLTSLGIKKEIFDESGFSIGIIE